MKGLGTQSDGRDLRDDLISKKDAILAGIKIMKAILLSTRERCVPRGLGAPQVGKG